MPHWQPPNPRARQSRIVAIDDPPRGRWIRLQATPVKAGEMNALTSGCKRRDVSRKRPRSGGTVTASPMRCSRDVAAAPSGWTPWLTTRQLVRVSDEDQRSAQLPIATALASDSWLASSTKRTSKTASNSGRARSQPVPATMSTAPAARASLTSTLVPTRVTPSRWPTWPSSSSAFWRARMVTPTSAAAATTAVSRLLIVLCDCAVMATILLRRTRSTIMCAPAKVLPVPGGPWIGNTPRSSSPPAVVPHPGHPRLD